MSEKVYYNHPIEKNVYWNRYPNSNQVTWKKQIRGYSVTEKDMFPRVELP